MLLKSNKKSRFVISVVFCCVFSTIAALAIINRQYIVDFITVANFKTSDEVIALVTDAGMNDNGKFLYLASQPVLDSTQNFNDSCNTSEVTVSILGCYVSGRIYLYDVTEEKLEGIRETTAAHETLHAAYARLSQDEKTKVDKLLDAEYAKLEENSEYSDLMAYYESAEPGEKYNELHSIIGTEVADISSELESYYSRYFSDRGKAVALNAKYKAVFSDLKKKADDLQNQANTLNDEITERSENYNNAINQLNSDIAVFNANSDSGNFTSLYQFNQQRNSLLARVSALESEKADIEASIEEYNSLIDEYNSIATESQKLTSSIDSTLAPAPSV